MAAGYCYCLGIKSNDFFLKDNKKAFILWLNVPKVTAYLHFYLEETSEAEKMQEYCIKITKTSKNDANEVEVVRSKAKFIKN